jgi:hypothetical protein
MRYGTRGGRPAGEVPKLAFGLDLQAGSEEQRSIISWDTYFFVLAATRRAVILGGRRRRANSLPRARLWPPVPVRVWELAASGPRPPRNDDGTCARSISWPGPPGGQGRLIPGLCSLLVVVAYLEHWRLTANASWRQQLAIATYTLL